MAEKYYAVKDSSLTELADAVREKAGTPSLGYTIAQMAYTIRNLKLDNPGEEVKIPEAALNLTADCSYIFVNGNYDWLLEQCAEEMTTADMTGAAYMFGSTGGSYLDVCNIESIPFDFNFAFTSTGHDVSHMFDGSKIAECGAIKSLTASNMEGMFAYSAFEYLPTFENLETKWTGGACKNFKGMFKGSIKLKEIPSTFLAELGNTSSYENPIYYEGFNNCRELTNLNGLPLYTGSYNIAVNTNMFVNTFDNCHKLSSITFKPRSVGLPDNVNWTNQTIRLNTNVGYSGYPQYAEDGVFNKTSAINLINSLPNTLYYNSENRNTIVFKGASGASNGGAINNMSEEQIAIATAKGWTVSYV